MQSSIPPDHRWRSRKNMKNNQAHLPPLPLHQKRVHHVFSVPNYNIACEKQSKPKLNMQKNSIWRTDSNLKEESGPILIIRWFSFHRRAEVRARWTSSSCRRRRTLQMNNDLIFSSVHAIWLQNSLCIMCLFLTFQFFGTLQNQEPCQHQNPD